jgi:hypothetical protein
VRDLKPVGDGTSERESWHLKVSPTISAVKSITWKKRQFFDNWLLTLKRVGRISRFTEREAAPRGLPDWFRQDP